MTTLATRDVLFYGWQDGKFVLLIMRDDKIAHRISLNAAETRLVSFEINNPSEKTQRVLNHKQVDSDVLPQEYTRAARYKPQQHVALRQLGVTSRTFGEGILVGTLNGEQCFSNGHLILIGEPYETKRAEKSPQFEQFLKYAVDAEPLRVVCAQAVSGREWEAQGSADCETSSVIWFDRGGCVDALYYDFVLERYPRAVFAVQQGDAETTPLVIYSSNDIDDAQGNLVGFLMSMRFTASAFVEQLRAELDSQPRTT